MRRPEGLGLVTVYVALVAAVWRHEKQPPVIGELAETLEEDDEPDADTEPTALGLALVLAGIAVMAVGGVFAVQGAALIVDALDVTDTAVGLTLVALATTAELLALAWAGAAVGVLITVLRLERWRGVGFALYLVLGWLAAIATPQLVRSLTPVEVGLLVAGGLLYTVGAVILARKQPDPRPLVFGYHEVWHTFVVGACACHFALVLLLVRA